MLKPITIQDLQSCKAKRAYKLPSQHINFPLFRCYFPNWGTEWDQGEVYLLIPFSTTFIISSTYATGMKHIST